MSFVETWHEFRLRIVESMGCGMINTEIVSEITLINKK